jgi:redox-sensitive bicupin YhaK (pirin superfamily)
VASSDGRNGSVTVHQDVNLYATLLGEGQELVYHGNPDRYVWLQVARGQITLNGQELEAGDGAAIVKETDLQLTGKSAEEAEVLLFDLA